MLKSENHQLMIDGVAYTIDQVENIVRVAKNIAEHCPYHLHMNVGLQMLKTTFEGIEMQNYDMPLITIDDITYTVGEVEKIIRHARDIAENCPERLRPGMAIFGMGKIFDEVKACEKTTVKDAKAVDGFHL